MIDLSFSYIKLEPLMINYIVKYIELGGKNIAVVFTINCYNQLILSIIFPPNSMYLTIIVFLSVPRIHSSASRCQYLLTPIYPRELIIATFSFILNT